MIEHGIVVAVVAVAVYLVIRMIIRSFRGSEGCQCPGKDCAHFMDCTEKNRESTNRSP